MNSKGTSSLTARLLRCGMAAGPVFTATFLADGATRPDYRPRRHPISSLALGSRGLIQTTNFVVTGVLILAGAVGLARDRDPRASSRLGAALVAAAGAALVGSAVFPTDPISGYPPGTPDAPATPTRTGSLHTLIATPVFLGLPAAQLVYARTAARAGRRGWGLYCAGSAAAMITTAGLFGAGFGQSPRLVDVAGLLQRAGIVTGFSWLTAQSAITARDVKRRPAR